MFTNYLYQIFVAAGYTKHPIIYCLRRNLVKEVEYKCFQLDYRKYESVDLSLSSIKVNGYNGEETRKSLVAAKTNRSYWKITFSRELRA
ncbi:hypothetical protein N7465_006567 [Penicillium sp. CMV-2018d]|nr:hypothetical protein N7465_006567 [Penicillium sp. CMV-2018d]